MQIRYNVPQPHPTPPRPAPGGASRGAPSTPGLLHDWVLHHGQGRADWPARSVWPEGLLVRLSPFSLILVPNDKLQSPPAPPHQHARYFNPEPWAAGGVISTRSVDRVVLLPYQLVARREFTADSNGCREGLGMMTDPITSCPTYFT